MSSLAKPMIWPYLQNGLALGDRTDGDLVAEADAARASVKTVAVEMELLAG